VSKVALNASNGLDENSYSPDNTHHLRPNPTPTSITSDHQIKRRTLLILHDFSLVLSSLLSPSFTANLGIVVLLTRHRDLLLNTSRAVRETVREVDVRDLGVESGLDHFWEGFY